MLVMKKIHIENLKGINQLSFQVPSSYGAYLLVGENGIGKTTLLTCLARICNARAFADGFATSSAFKAIDQYEGSSIAYEVDDNRIVFHRKSKRWVPSPKRNAQSRLSAFGFDGLIFISATSKRIDATAEEIRRGNYEDANPHLRDNLNRIFETDRFNDLSILKISNGRGKPATKIYVMRTSTGTYSEKRFSTGELAIIRLFEYIEEANADALILIDEAEMALHPRIQRNLYKFLYDISLSKQLFIFLSTHSAVMIQMAKKESIYLLEDMGERNVSVVNPCYPAKAIGCVDYVEMGSFDSIFFVEDDVAAVLLKQMIKRYIEIKDEHITLNYAITPVGGFYETARMAVNTKEKLFSNLDVFAVVDEDAFDDLESKPKFRELLQSEHRHLIHSLNCTPEVWYIKCLEQCTTPLANEIRGEFRLDIHRLTVSEEYTALVHAGQNERKTAKAKKEFIIDKIVANTELNNSTAEKELVQLLVKHMDTGVLMRTIAPMINTSRR